jgi:hypothetical protein
VLDLRKQLVIIGKVSQDPCYLQIALPCIATLLAGRNFGGQSSSFYKSSKKISHIWSHYYVALRANSITLISDIMPFQKQFSHFEMPNFRHVYENISRADSMTLHDSCLVIGSQPQVTLKTPCSAQELWIIAERSWRKTPHLLEQGVHNAHLDQGPYI